MADTSVYTHNFQRVNFPALADTEANFPDPLVDLDDTVKFAVGNDYHSGLLKLVRIDLVDFDPIQDQYGITQLKLTIERNGGGKNDLGVKEQVSYINIVSRSDAAVVLQACSSADTNNSHWQADNRGIHYASGNVGVGVVDAAAPMHIVGGYNGAGPNPFGKRVGQNASLIIENTNSNGDHSNANIALLVNSNQSKNAIQFADNEDEGTGNGWDAMIQYDHALSLLTFVPRADLTRSMMLEDNGQVRIGYPFDTPPVDATAEQYALDVSSQPNVAGGSGIRILGNETAPGVGRARLVLENGAGIGVTGESTIDGNLVVSQTVTGNSDQRMKEKISPLFDSLSRVKQITGVNFFWKPEFIDNEDKQIGVIAQEVQKVFSELVKEDDQGMLTVNYAGLTAPLINDVSELDQKIIHQQAQIDRQQEQIEFLMNELKALKKAP